MQKHLSFVLKLQLFFFTRWHKKTFAKQPPKKKAKKKATSSNLSKKPFFEKIG